MIRRLLLLLAFSSQLIALSAQTAKTRANLYTQIDSSLPSNTSGAITAATLRTVFKDTIASGYNQSTDGSAWLLPTFTASTISTGQNGLGWDENGRVTLQTPVGALQFYTTGSPAESVIYWPGRIITNTIDAGTLTGYLAANRINAPLGSETIDASIVSRSLAPPLDKWQQGQSYAGAVGMPYILDTDFAPGTNLYEPTVGVYFPEANVTAGGTASINQIAGRYRTATQVKSDLAIAAADLTATGTKDSTTYLRGDNTWATVSGGGAVTSVAGRTGAVTLTTADVSGALSTTTAASTYATAASLNDFSRTLNPASIYTTGSVNADGSVQAANFYGDGGNVTGLGAANITFGTLATARLPAQTTASVRTVTANATILSTNAVVVCTGSGGITLTLPAANANTPRVTQLEIINRTSGTVTLARAGSDLFEGDTTALITTGASWSITSDASSKWYLY